MFCGDGLIAIEHCQETAKKLPDLLPGNAPPPEQLPGARAAAQEPEESASPRSPLTAPGEAQLPWLAWLLAGGQSSKRSSVKSAFPGIPRTWASGQPASDPGASTLPKKPVDRTNCVLGSFYVPTKPRLQMSDFWGKTDLICAPDPERVSLDPAAVSALLVPGSSSSSSSSSSIPRENWRDLTGKSCPRVPLPKE